MSDVFKDQEEIRNSVIQIRDNGKTRWVAFGYQGSDTSISVIQSGENGIEEFKPLLLDDKVIYVLFGYLSSEQDQNVQVIQKLKFILITHVGNKVKPLEKARSSQHRVTLYSLINNDLQLAGELHVVSADEVSDTSIAQKLTGSRLETHSEVTTSSTPSSSSSKQSKFNFSDENASNEAIQDVRNDKTTTNWATWEYDNSFESLVLIGKGSGGYKEVEPQFQAGKVLYALLGLPTTEGDYNTIKYILVTWVGEGVKPLIKAKSSQDRVFLYQHISKFLQLGGEWQAQSLDDISEAKLVAKLEGSVLQEEKNVSTTQYKATKTDGINRANPDYQPVNTGPVKVDFANEAESIEALKDLRDAKDNCNWLVFGYKDNSLKIELINKGEGDFSNIEPYLDEKAIIYAIVGVPFGTDDYIQIKFCFISWVGPRAKPKLKALSSQHRVALYNFSNTIFPLAGEIQALSRDEISHELIKKKLIGTTILNEEQEIGYSGRSTNVKKEGVENFEFLNQEEIDNALKEVRDDASETNWAVIDYVKDSHQLKLRQSGAGGLEAIVPLLNDSEIFYIVFGTVQKDGDYSQVKYIFVTFIGKDVKPLHKARSSQHRVKLYSHVQTFMQLAGEIQILNREDLNEKNLVSKLSGSRMISDEQAKLATRKTVIAKGSMEKFGFENEEEYNNAIKSLVSEENDYVVLGDSKDQITVIASGKGQLEEVKKYFEDDNVRYAILSYKVVEVVDDVDYTRSKNIFISWTGPNVKPLAKARSSQQRVTLYNNTLKLIALHGQLHAEKKEDLSEDDIMEKFTGARTQNESKIKQEAERLKSLESSTSSQPQQKSEEVNVDISTFFKQEEEVGKILSGMRENDSQINWVSLRLENQKVVLFGSGDGGVEEFKSKLDDSSIIFAVVSLREDEKLTSEGYATKKFIQVNWVGKDCKPLEKAASSQLRVPLNTKLFNKYLQLSAELQALTKDDISEDSLRDKITGSRVKVE